MIVLFFIVILKMDKMGQEIIFLLFFICYMNYMPGSLVCFLLENGLHSFRLLEGNNGKEK